MLFHPFSLLPFLLAASFAFAQNWTASPFIPPAIPLAVKTPYIQTWKQQGTADGSLNVGWATFRDSTVGDNLNSFGGFQALTRIVCACV